jgi:hypothetical protein
MEIESKTLVVKVTLELSIEELQELHEILGVSSQGFDMWNKLNDFLQGIEMQ